MNAFNEYISTSLQDQDDIRISPTTTSLKIPIINTSSMQEESVLYLLPHKTFKQRKVKGKRRKIWEEKERYYE